MKEHESTGHNTQTIAWIQGCLDLSRRKIVALMRNDLTDLEQCIEEEEKLLSLRPVLKAGGTLPQSVILELRALNDRNRVLVENGFEFSRAMLHAIRPPTTYSALVSHRALGEKRPGNSESSLLSVKC